MARYTDILFKKCSKCKEERPYYLFNEGKCKDGKFPFCKICINKVLRKKCIILSYTPLEPLKLLDSCEERKEVFYKTGKGRMIMNIKSRFSKLIEKYSDKTKEMIIKEYAPTSKYGVGSQFGCSHRDLIKYIESLFTKEMNWENYGTFWQIDHIESIWLIKDKSKFNHYTNLQPLSETDHKIKNKNEQAQILKAKQKQLQSFI